MARNDLSPSTERKINLMWAREPLKTLEQRVTKNNWLSVWDSSSEAKSNQKKNHWSIIEQCLPYILMNRSNLREFLSRRVSANESRCVQRHWSINTRTASQIIEYFFLPRSCFPFNLRAFIKKFRVASKGLTADFDNSSRFSRSLVLLNKKLRFERRINFLMKRTRGYDAPGTKRWWRLSDGQEIAFETCLF